MSDKPAKIEVKYAIEPAFAQVAMQRLELDGTDPQTERTIHFFDTHGTTLSPGGLILRARQTTAGDAPDDSTLKVRGVNAPAVAAQHLGGAPGERKYEGDMNAGRAELPSFSLTLDQEEGSIRAVLDREQELPASLFSPEAAELLAKAGVDWDELYAYTPIQARVWKIHLQGLQGKVTVEVWQAGDQVLVEVSDKVDRDKAEDFATALAALLADELELPQLPGSKTQFALAQLHPPQPLRK